MDGEKEYILTILETLEHSVAKIELPGFTNVTVLDDIKPDSFQYAINEIKKYVNEEKEEKNGWEF